MPTPSRRVSWIDNKEDETCQKSNSHLTDIASCYTLRLLNSSKVVVCLQEDQKKSDSRQSQIAYYPRVSSKIASLNLFVFYTERFCDKNEKSECGVRKIMLALIWGKWGITGISTH